MADEEKEPELIDAVRAEYRRLVPKDLPGEKVPLDLLVNQLSRGVPVLKLENMDRRTVNSLLGYMYASCILSLAVACMFAVSLDDAYLDIITPLLTNSEAEEEEETRLSFSYAASTMYILGIVHLLAIIQLTFLLITYPQRIIMATLRDSITPTPEQAIVTILVFVFVLNPLFNIAGLVCHWQDIIDATRLWNTNTTLEWYVVYLNAFNCREVVSDYEKLMIVVCLTLLLLFWGALVYSIGDNRHPRNVRVTDSFEDKQGKVIEDGLPETGEQDETPPKTDEQENEEGGGIVGETPKNRFLELLGNMILLERMKWVGDSLARFWTTIIMPKLNCVSEQLLCLRCECCFYTCCCFYCFKKSQCQTLWVSMQVFKRGLTTQGFGLVFTYFILLVTLSFVYEFDPSMIPLVSIISVLRVCTYENDGVPLNLCQQGTKAYGRAVSVVFIFIFEALIFLFNYYLAIQTRRKLRALPYNKYRHKHLGYNYFRTVNSVSWFFAVLIGIVIVSVPSADIWLISVNETASDEGLSSIVLDPLARVGMGSVSTGYSSYLFVLSNWIFILAAAYLPADSIGFQGWFCPSTEEQRQQRDTEEVRARQEDWEHPIYLVREYDIQLLQDLQRRTGVSNNDRNNPRLMERIEKDLFFSQPKETNTARDEYELEDGAADIKSQLRSNVFVLETHVLLLNFACAAYLLGNETSQDKDALDSKKLSTKSSLSIKNENDQASAQSKDVEVIVEDPKAEFGNKVVQDERYQYVGHIYDKPTDTHAFIAKSEDRIILSFRGTVSGVNVKTDLDYNLVPHLESASVSIKHLSSLSVSERKAAQKQPQVHKGFYLAYKSVAEQVREKVQTLLDENQARVILCTGHSLGGALACCCAIDLAIIHGRGRVGCTTFGAPRVGSFPFIHRYRSLVPSHFRFENIGDAIPHVPPSSFLGGLDYRGYFHCGVEISMDIGGNLVISPSFVERSLMRGLSRYKTENHFRSKYLFSLISWAASAHFGEWKPRWWVENVGAVNRFCKSEFGKVDIELVAKMQDHLDVEGATFVSTTNKIELRNVAIQTVDADVFPIEKPEPMSIDEERNALRPIDERIDPNPIGRTEIRTAIHNLLAQFQDTTSNDAPPPPPPQLVEQLKSYADTLALP